MAQPVTPAGASSLGPLKVTYDAAIPVLVIPDDLPFGDLRDWIRDRMPTAIDAIGGRASRLDLGTREIQLFDLRRLIHLLRDEYSIDVTGIYVAAGAVHRYAEKELKLKLFLRGQATEAKAPTEPPRKDEAALAWGERRQPARDAAPAPDDGDPSTETTEEAPALPGMGDLLAALTGGPTSAPAAEPPKAAEKVEKTEKADEFELFEPAAALRRPIPLPDMPKDDPEVDADGGRRALTIRRTLRSGAAIRYEGDVVIMGDVNAGAQVRASGNIIVMGRLRGVVHAGANGDDTAFILAFDLAPTQLRIGRQIAIAPDAAARGDIFFPEIATLIDGQVAVEPWKGRLRR